jgi:3-oxoacyl-[acyl-carrier protein] reductase
MKLQNLNALITGGSQGLGRVIASHYLAAGANVVLCARSEAELFATRDELARQFPAQKVLARACDVANEAQVNALVAYTLQELGSLDALVLNAGIYGPMGDTESVSLDEWRRALDINLFGVLLPCRAVIPYFTKKRARQNRDPVRRRRDQSAAANQRLRRLQGRRGAPHGNARPGIVEI